MRHLSLLLSLAPAVLSGFVKVDIDDGGQTPKVRPRDSKGFLKLDFETETVGKRLKPRQIDEEDLDQNITLASQRSVCDPFIVLDLVLTHLCSCTG